MPELTKVGWGFKQDQVEDSVKEAIEELQIPVSREDPTHYITFEKVYFKRDTSADSSLAIKQTLTFEKSILAKIYADIVEYDGHKKTVHARDLQVGQLPQLLEGRNTFIVTGSEYNLIKFPQRGVCLYKCGNERYNLAVHAPAYKEKLFGKAGGR